MTRIRTLNFLPEIFQTPTNRQFLSATLDQIVNPPNTKNIQGYIGSKFGYGINAKDYYVTEPTKTRTDYQLDPGVVFTKKDEMTAKDFISYPGIVDALKSSGGITENNDKLFNSQFYSWDSFTDLDKIINFNQYYWLPDGPPAVTVSTTTVYTVSDFLVTSLDNAYLITEVGSAQGGALNPTLTLLRGGTYFFNVNQNSQFWIQTEPGTSGKSLVNPNQSTRLEEVNGVTNNGTPSGIVTFTVPPKDAQNEFNFPGDNKVDLVTSLHFDKQPGTLTNAGNFIVGKTYEIVSLGNTNFKSIGAYTNKVGVQFKATGSGVGTGVAISVDTEYLNGRLLSELGGTLDGITDLDNLSIMFYDTKIVDETGTIQTFYSQSEYSGTEGAFDQNLPTVNPITVAATATTAITNYITLSSVADLTIDNSITFTGIPFGGIQTYDTNNPVQLPAGSFNVGQKYVISSLGNTDWIAAGLSAESTAAGSITGTSLHVPGTNTFQIGQTITGAGVASGTKIISYDLFNSYLNGYDVYVVNNSQTVASTILSAYSVSVGSIFTATNSGSGNGIASVYKPTIYYITDIDSVNNKIKISETLGGSNLTLTTATGSLTANVNQGLFNESYTTQVNDWFYKIQLLEDPDFPGDKSKAVIRLVEYAEIPTNQKITVNFGDNFAGLTFFKNSLGAIQRIPLISAPLDVLYYQDGTNPNKVGQIKIIENNNLNTLNVDTEILGKKNFSINVPNGQTIVFTNGLKVQFDGDIIPTKYLQGQYYVEGVGSGIKLIPVDELNVPEKFTKNTYQPYDILPYDIGNYDNSLFIPVDQDYITIARGSLSRNAWSRSNRWFHIDVINATSIYNNDPEIAIQYAPAEAKAKRPIIEFYPNLRLFESGVTGKDPIDFIDWRTTDAFTYVAGQQNYYPDVEIYTAYTAIINATPGQAGGTSSSPIAVTSLTADDNGLYYKITDLGSPVDQTMWNNLAGTNFYLYDVGDVIKIEDYTQASGNGKVKWMATTTTININANDVYTGHHAENTGSFKVGQFITDIPYPTEPAADSVIPFNAIISEISGTSNLTLTITWDDPTIIEGTSNSSLIADDINNANYVLFPGARIVFAEDQNLEVRNKIFVVNYSTVEVGYKPVITLTVASDGDVKRDDMVVALRGYSDSGLSHYFDGLEWLEAQQKETVNQSPLFDVFDKNDISLSNQEFYVGSSFKGCKLFAYGLGNGANDPVLGFPIRYSQINNVGDISFDVSFNSDTFNYVSSQAPVTENVNVGYVYNYDPGPVISADNFELGKRYKIISLGDTDWNFIADTIDIAYKIDDVIIVKNKGTGTGLAFNLLSREIGWQTAVAESVQYQIFEFNYTANVPAVELNEGSYLQYTITCDVSKLNANDIAWPTLKVYRNNKILTQDQYTVSVGPRSTTIIIKVTEDVDTVYQVAILSDQVSSTAYYSIPINLANNPFNTDITKADIGDIRGQYQSMFENNPNSKGMMFGPNNMRDLGDVVPYGNKIIQNSASLVLPAVFLRNHNHDLFNSLMFNSREYIKFKTLLIDTVNRTDLTQRYSAAQYLDDALDSMTSTKNQSQPFFWSDMIPNKAPYITNIYKFANNLDTSIYPLDRIYDFGSANYYSVLVYLTRTVNSIEITRQLIKNIDYTVSTDSPSLTVTTDLLPGDIVTVKEYNQTYGSYVPNTPTKLGLYPATIPSVILDSNYKEPTYFIRGHDGSYNKLYGEYIPELDILIDFRDQVLLEYEKRVYNNLKLSEPVPVQLYEVVPGYFNDSELTYDEFLEIYSYNFLDWIGQNRLDFKTQLYNKNDQWSYNYTGSGNKINNQPIEIGYWRGIYEYFYGTSTPNTSPWEMIGYTNMPDWWTARYGAAPYTSGNEILWTDMANGYDYGKNIIIEAYARPQLLQILPVDEQGNLKLPLDCIIGNYNAIKFKSEWKVGDDAPVELSYRRSSTYPFDLMKILALTKPAKFFNLGVDLDNYKYNAEFNQYLVNDRKHLIISDIEIYGNGTAKTSYINWIVDYEKQLGVNATQNIKDLLFDLDVRLVYRLAGFSDKALLKFYVEKGTPNSRNASLLIPDESYGVLLYENQPYDRLIYSSVIVQITPYGYTVYGNSQTNAYFKILKPKNNGNLVEIRVQDLKAKVAVNYTTDEELVPYGTQFLNVQDVCQFLMSYGSWLESRGAVYDNTENGVGVTWRQMAAEFLYWAQIGWEIGSVTTLNPSATYLKINKESQVVQPLTITESNFILNQNLYPLNNNNLNILRDGTEFTVQTLNKGDSISYGQFNLSNIEHGIVFDNLTLFDDVIYNLVTGLRQNRIFVRGVKTADWNGTLNAWGFIYNQDNIKEWSKEVKYTKGEIVKYKNRYWIALKIVQPGFTFQEAEWKETDYNEIQKGLLPNSSTRSYESNLYYNVDKANLEVDADQLSFSLIGFRPRDYLALADLTDITQVNVYKNLIKNKGTKNSVYAFKGANLPQGGIDYEVYENWAIKVGEFGGVLNSNFAEFKLSESKLTGNPSIVSLTKGIPTPGSLQEVPLYTLYNYNRPITDPNILPTISEYVPSTLYPDAGYVNFNDVKMSSYFYSQLATAQDKNGVIIPIQNFYVHDYVWIANYLNDWQIYTPVPLTMTYGSCDPGSQVVAVRSNLNGTATITFNGNHGLSQYQIFAIVNFNPQVDGYYIANQILSPTQVIISLSLAVNTRNLTGQGIALKFQSQRVDKPSDIVDLPLLNSEFAKNTVWVDENNDGGWAVYRKNLNYQYENEFTKPASERFGSSVAYNKDVGYLIGDPALGEVYRYTYNLSKEIYEINETLTQDSGVNFGAAIAHKDQTYFISNPDDGMIYWYTLNDTVVTDDLLYLQRISAPSPYSEFGSTLALSGDTNWLYVSAYQDNKVEVYKKQNVDYQAGYLTPGEVYQIKELGDSDFTTVGAVQNKVGIKFVAGLTNVEEIVAGQDYTIFQIGNTNFTAIGAASNTIGLTFTATGPGVGTGTAYASNALGTGTGVATLISYQNVYTIDGSVWPIGDEFGKSISTNYHGDKLAIGAPGHDFSVEIENWGQAFVYDRITENIEAQATTLPDSYQAYDLGYSPYTLTASVLDTSAGNIITCTDTTNFAENDAVMFTGSAFEGSALQTNKVYYINSIPAPGTITLKTSRSSTTEVTLVPITPSATTAGNFVQGATYRIVSVGTTDFTLIGAPDNNVGTVFIATGIGSGTGTATITMVINVQKTSLEITRNGRTVDDSNYAVVGNKLYYSGTLNAGDLLNVGTPNFVLLQTFDTGLDPHIGVSYGKSLDFNRTGTELLIGAPYSLNSNIDEGKVFRYTNSSAKYGTITGTTTCDVTTSRPILINGYLIYVEGNASDVATLINNEKLTNVVATANNGILTISCINNSLAPVNQKLTISALDTDVLDELGLVIYPQTQVIDCPHLENHTAFGSAIKFNEHDSVIISAPTATRFSATTFDFIDDENYNNDTIFDNNATTWVDTFMYAGAVYMFDYLSNYNENLSNIGNFVYSQNVNSKNLVYGLKPMYGMALEYIDNRVMIGSPDFMPTDVDGQVITYVNNTGLRNWTVFRQSSPIVDVNRIQNSQIFSAETNDTLINLDYIDPLQGKILGAVRQNIDYISNNDPASYNNGGQAQRSLVWGSDKVGSLWFDTTNIRYVNYHQNDPVYNAKYWGTLFPNSDVAIYSWIGSNVNPANYTGPGIPYDVTKFTVETTFNANNTITPVYFFWVRNTNTVFKKRGKTLSDGIIATYITNPRNSGISYFAPLLPNTFALYNTNDFVRANDSVFHIGYSNSENDDIAHSEYNLVRANYKDDFLPGFPGVGDIVVPESLYDRMLDSLAGVDETGQVVPNILLPKAVQSGVLARPRQSFFYNRYLALKNYLQYVNGVLSQYPITELRNFPFLYKQNSTTYEIITADTIKENQECTITYIGTTDFTTIGASANVVGTKFIADGPASGTGKVEALIFTEGQQWDTSAWWEFANWWAVGYDDNTKAALQVPLYTDLSKLNVAINTIVTVQKNGNNVFETYRYDGSGVWTRIGLMNGTIRFKNSLWDYNAANLGFGGDFYSTTSYDDYPSEPTRWIIRSINEELFTNELLIFRNKALILLFEYIQSETSESQNFLPWLNKTSLVDVSHTIRELVPLEVYKTDNQDFLAGYLNEAKPYHVVIKEFLFEYKKTDLYEGDITDFDLPAKYNASVDQFESPQLVYESPAGSNQYLPNDPIWSEGAYSQWRNNYGLSLVGQENYFMTTLEFYLPVGERNVIVVANASGFPINGVIKIGNEQISYGSVDRDKNLLTNLSRGFNNTEQENHLPGSIIYMDLPAVILLDGGSQYVNPPKITAVIDTELYGEPRVPAILEAVMSLDSVLSINVINPGSGYAVLPEIVIEPSSSIEFSSTGVNTLLNTIELYAPTFRTGALVKYIAGLAGNIPGLKDNQWYYVNVLDSSPVTVVALYTTYSDSINDTNRVQLNGTGSGDDHRLNLGAKASTVTSAGPIRENNLTFRYDRTTYRSQIIDWEAGVYYSSFFAGNYNGQSTLSSSSLTLYQENPNINDILSAAQGVIFDVAYLRNERTLDWSSFERSILSTNGTTDTITLIPVTTTENASGSTIGMTVGMPVKFIGQATGTNITVEQTYYVAEIVSDTDFKISSSSSGSPVLNLNSATIGAAGLKCYTAKVTDTAVITTHYSGIRNITSTTAGTNVIRVPRTLLGGQGTLGFYQGLPLIYTGQTFGGIVENQQYYVTSVLDSEHFTMGENNDPQTYTISETALASSTLTTTSTYGLSVNEAVVFNQMVIDDGYFIAGQTYTISNIGNSDWNNIAGTVGVSYSVGDIFVAVNAGNPAATGTAAGTVFGGVVAGKIYYIRQVISLAEFTISEQINGPAIQIDDCEGKMTLTSQKDTVNLSNVNVEIAATALERGKEYIIQTVYDTDFTLVGAENNNIGTRFIATGPTVGTGTAVEKWLTLNMSLPVSPGQVNKQRFSLYQTSSQYANPPINTIDANTLISSETSSTVAASDILVLDEESGGTQGMYVNMPFQLSGTIGSNLLSATTYYVANIGQVTVEVTSTTAGNLLFTTDTSQLSNNTPLVFSGVGIGGVVIGDQYFVVPGSIVTDTSFKISNTPSGAEVDLSADNGSMTGKGNPYIQVSSTAGGAIIPVDTEIKTVTLLQKPSSSPLPSFDISYLLGGYNVTVDEPGEGWAINNAIIIQGDVIGGTTPENNLTVIVNDIDDYGRIKDVIAEGIPAGSTNKYYFKINGENEFKVYSDPRCTVPVSGLTSPFNTAYTGYTTSYVETISGNTITLDDASSFNLNDAVIFTGDVQKNNVEAISLNTGDVYEIVNTGGGSTNFVSAGAAFNNIGITFTASGTASGTGYAKLIGSIEPGKIYYIRSISGNNITLTDNPGGGVFSINADTTESTLIMTKAGSFAQLPEPFYFDQSIVRYRNKVYRCIISNNDKEFIFGKWEELDSGSRLLNAMDRAIGYYKPNQSNTEVWNQWLNMPGLDLSQLFTGVTYPNSTYLGNPFQPDEQYPLDTVLVDQPFSPTQVNMTGVIVENNKYLAITNLPNYSGMVINPEPNSWQISSLTNSPIGLSSLTKTNGTFLMTSTNKATPIFRSADGKKWSAKTSYSQVTLPINEIPDDTTRLTGVSLYATAYKTVTVGTTVIPVYVAVGEKILISYDTVLWREAEGLDPDNNYVLYDVCTVDIPGIFSGFVAVGKGDQTIYNPNATTVGTNLIYVSTNGINWTKIPSLTTNGLYSVTSNSSEIVAVGEQGVVYISSNGYDWLGVTETTVVNVNGATDILNVTNTAGFAVGNKVKFSDTFDVLSTSTEYKIQQILNDTQMRISVYAAADVTVGGFVLGKPYMITDLGTTTQTDWNTITGGAGPWAVGDYFVCANIGLGMGTGKAIPLVDFSGAGTIPYQTLVYKAPRLPKLNVIEYLNGYFIAAGNDGIVLTSTNGNLWTAMVSGTTSNLNAMTYSSNYNQYIIVGDDNTIVTSNDLIVWSNKAILTVPNPVYNVIGDPFTAGYGPEELVPGNVLDNVVMTITTRPGTNWDAEEYQHVGYSVVSLEFTPTSASDLEFGFNDVCQTPIQVYCAIIDAITGLSTTIYEGTGYTVDWINKTVTLLGTDPLNYNLPGDPNILRVDVYQVGNGEQLVKSNTDSDPIVPNGLTGFSEIQLSCNYQAEIYAGGGVFQPGSPPIQVLVNETKASNDLIYVTDVSKFKLNEPIYFTGAVYGNLLEDTPYYVKEINPASNTISVSDTLTGLGIAGVTFELADGPAAGEGPMFVIINQGSGVVYTYPVVYKNGEQLLYGHTGTVLATKSTSNTIVCNSTAVLTAGDAIKFASNMYGSVTPLTTYYIKQIIDDNEFTISTTPGGSVVSLTAGAGEVIYVVNDYGIGLANNNINAKLVFAEELDKDVDYLAYSILGETLPSQYGYTLPETQIITGTGTTFALDNYIGGDNADNAIVEVDGLRLDGTQYNIDFINQEIVLTNPLSSGQTLAVTSFNDTQRQAFNTQWGITGKTVANITGITNAISVPNAITVVSATDATTDTITCTTTTDFIANQPVMFKAGVVGAPALVIGQQYKIYSLGDTDWTSCGASGTPTVGEIFTATAADPGTTGVAQPTLFANISTDGVTYYVVSGFSPTSFQISTTPGGPVFDITSTVSGTIVAYVGGQDAVEVTTGINNGFATNDVVRIDGTLGSVQLNNNTYFVRVISDTKFALYNQPYDSSLTGLNNPVTTISTYISGGFAFLNQTFIIVNDYDQTNPDRLWVTINGERVASSRLIINDNNNLSILSTIIPADDIIITSMMPTATPDEEIYINIVDDTGEGSVYRANTNTRTWLTRPLNDLDTEIHVNDVTRITNTIEYTRTTLPSIDGYRYFGIIANKNDLVQVLAYNATKMISINSAYIDIVIKDNAPLLQIMDGAWIDDGDEIKITCITGKLIYINGELIHIHGVNFDTNTLTNVHRGADGTGINALDPIYTEVYSLLDDNKMSQVNYDKIWNSYDYNPVEGDPLQISTTQAARFLRTDIT